MTEGYDAERARERRDAYIRELAEGYRLTPSSLNEALMLEVDSRDVNEQFVKRLRCYIDNEHLRITRLVDEMFHQAAKEVRDDR